MKDFQFRHGSASLNVLLEARFAFDDFGPDSVRSPAVAFAEQADEERAAGADFVEAELEGFRAGALLLGNAPARIRLDQFHLPLAAEPAQFGPSMGQQFIALPIMSRKVEETKTRMRRLSFIVNQATAHEVNSIQNLN